MYILLINVAVSGLYSEARGHIDVHVQTDYRIYSVPLGLLPLRHNNNYFANGACLLQALSGAHTHQQVMRADSLQLMHGN